MKQLKFIIYIGLIGITLNAQGVSQSKHNLSASGKGKVKSMDNAEVCLFCHTSHSQNPKAPMWNRKQSGVIYTLYNSSTMDAKPGQPDGTSILCLSCHDGTVALGNTLKKPNVNAFANAMTKRGNLGTDLSDDHPISFVYNSQLTASDIELKDVASLPSNFLDHDGKVQCTSCHNPHENIQGDFLNVSNEFSNLCFKCHDKQYWGNSSHNVSTKVWNGKMPNPWAHIDSPYNNVAQNACSNCHDVHNASGKERLLKQVEEENNCFDCHNGNVAKTNIQLQFSKAYKHNVYYSAGTHDPTETETNMPRHVECADCHNAHASNNLKAVAPFVNGANIGVKGINQIGSSIDEVNYEYEICFRCHADNPMVPEYTTRYLGSVNTRADFNPDNISFHPVIEKGKNNNPKSLILPYNSNSKIYCSSCHASDGKESPAGPHGSIYPRILKANYNMDKTPQLGKSWPSLIQSNFTLCFECHEVNAVTNIHTQISKGHFMETIGCNSCHDPHGYEGGSLSENAFGINFDQTVIQPNPVNGRMIDLNQKKCFMTCHDPKGVVNYTHKPEGSDY